MNPEDARMFYEKIPVGTKKMKNNPLDVKVRGMHEVCFSLVGNFEGE